MVYYENGTAYIPIITNTVLNFYDIYMAFRESWQGLLVKNFEKVGYGIGRMAGDILIKNPIDTAWSFRASLVYPNGEAILMSEKPKE